MLRRIVPHVGWRLAARSPHRPGADQDSRLDEALDPDVQCAQLYYTEPGSPATHRCTAVRRGRRLSSRSTSRRRRCGG